MKKIMNSPQMAVMEMCAGIALANSSVEFIPEYKIIKRKKLNEDKVTIICGGGSGHEPAYAGYVGEGMIDVAVCGDVFASPSQIQVYQAIKRTAGKKGTLLIIKNYSGDMMNFKNAAAMAREDGLEVDYVCVNDDIAVQDSLYTVGRRGVAGTVLVAKAAGAAAEQGKSLQEVKKIAQKAIDNVRSVGVALAPCTVPVKGSPTFTLAEDEIEYGIGIHGEPGVRREKLQTAETLAGRMVNEIVSDLDLKEGENTAVLINGFGGTPLMELYIYNYCVRKEMAYHHLPVSAVLVGSYMTSIEMQGISLSLMRVDEDMEKLLFAPAEVSALHISDMNKAVPFVDCVYFENNRNVEISEIILKGDANLNGREISCANLIHLVEKMSDVIIEREQEFCKLDSFAGDGDFGMSIAKGFRKLKERWSPILAKCNGDMGEFLDECAMVIMEFCGGASGPIWGSAFRAAGKVLKGKNTADRSEFAKALRSAVDGIWRTGERSFGRGAEVGDKTLIDALVPCVEYWEKYVDTDISTLDIFKMGAEEAEKGAKSTEQIVARMGRAGTVGKRSLGHPDAGAFGLAVIFNELAKSLK